MKQPALFTTEEMRDKSATALRPDDTFIQQQSKRFARQTILPGEARHLMLAYQAGAKNMQRPVLEALCKDCPSKGSCIANDEFEDCEGYTNILELFTK